MPPMVEVDMDDTSSPHAAAVEQRDRAFLLTSVVVRGFHHLDSRVKGLLYP